jgi:glycosyltransferase involved in cell wall biosynthesis
MANARLWIIGDGPYRSACASLAAELGISDRVRFFGFMPREQLDAYYAAADVFAFASITETQGLVIQEAMLHRLAVVAVAGGGASESIRANENAILTADNPEFLGSAILALLQDDDLRQRIADRGFDSQRSQTVTAMVDRIVGVYEKVLSRGADADAIPE